MASVPDRTIQRQYDHVSRHALVLLPGEHDTRNIQLDEWKIGTFLSVELLDNDHEDHTICRKPNAQGPPFPFLRLLVIRPGKRSSTCLCVEAYGEQATTRPDVLPYQSQHGIIYDGSRPPKRAMGEDHLLESIQVDLTDGAKPLCSYLRINYGRPVEVLRDTKAQILGTVNDRHLSVLASNSNAAYEAPQSRSLLECRLPTRDVWIFENGNTGDRVIAGALLDTGACANFMSEHVAAQVNVQKEEYDGDSVLAANGVKIIVESVARLRWRFINRPLVYMDEFLVVKDLEGDVIIGYPTLEHRSFLHWNNMLCILGFSKQSKEKKKLQDDEATRKAKENREAENRELAEKIRQLTQDQENKEN